MMGFEGDRVSDNAICMARQAAWCSSRTIVMRDGDLEAKK